MKGSIFGLAVLLLSMTLAYADANNDPKEPQRMEKLIFALKVTDSSVYQNYRDAISPIMDRLNVKVLKEYQISDVLHSQDEDDQVSRLAVFGFPNESSKLQFFNDPIYLEAKTLFNASTKNFIKIIE